MLSISINFTMAEITPINQRKSLFYAETIEALQSCRDTGYHPADMITIADERIAAPNNSPLWHNLLSSTSIRATGYTKQGHTVDVYVHNHLTNHFGDPARIKQARERGLWYYAACLSQPEFQAMVDADGSTDVRGNRLVWAVDHGNLRESPSGVIPVDQALDHPQTIPFLGGQKRAEQYLSRHKEVIGSGIGVWHINNLNNTPVAYVLCLGGDLNGLDGDGNLSYIDTRVLGVREGSAAGAT